VLLTLLPVPLIEADPISVRFSKGHLEKLSTNRYRTALKSRQQRRHEMRKSTTV
jgi:hypothetical protein